MRDLFRIPPIPHEDDAVRTGEKEDPGKEEKSQFQLSPQEAYKNKKMSWPCHHCQMIADIERNKVLDVLADDVLEILEMLADESIPREEIARFIKMYLIRT